MASEPHADDIAAQLAQAHDARTLAHALAARFTLDGKAEAAAVILAMADGLAAETIIVTGPPVGERKAKT